MVLGVHHMGLKIGDIRKTTWLDHVGSRENLPWVSCANVHIKLEETEPKDQQAYPARAVNSPGIAHICLQSRDIDEGLAQGVAAGLVPISGPVDLGTDFRYLYAHTRDGILLELEGAPFVRDTGPRFWVGHVAFVARNIEALVDFYGRALGLTPSPVSRLRHNAPIDQVAGMKDVDLSAMWLPGLNLGLEFWHYHHPPVSPDAPDPVTGFSYICFESGDFNTDCARILAQGGVSKPTQDLGLTKCRSASFADPEGNAFHVVAFTNPDDPMAIQNLANKNILDIVAAQRPPATGV